MFRSWVLMEIWIIDLSSSLVTMLMSSSKLFLFLNEAHLNSGVHCETVIVALLCFSHHACCLLYIWVKLTVAFTCTRLRFNLYTSIFGCGFSDLNKNFGGSMDFAKQRQGTADLLSPIHPLLKFASTHLRVYTWVDSGTMRVKYLAQCKMTIQCPALEPEPLDQENWAHNRASHKYSTWHTVYIIEHFNHCRDKI